MTMVKKSLTVTDPQSAWMEVQMAEGGYASESELVREMICDRQKRMAELDVIRAKLIEGEESARKHGFVTQTPEQILADFKVRARRNGDL